MKKITFYTATLLSFIIMQAATVRAQWTNGQNATYVVGQVNFTTAVTGTTDSTFSAIGVVEGGCAIDSKHGVMYISDFFSHRVLRYAYPLTKNSAIANLVIGQASFTASSANSGGLSASSLEYPGACTVDTVTGTLWVADNGNQRVLRYDSAYKIVTNMPAANQVLGQKLFTTSASSCTDSTIKINNGPITGNLVYYDQQNNALWIVDNGNNRVLRFDDPEALANGASAVAVLGQASFTSNSIGSGQNGFNRPDGVTTIGGSLYVSDANDNRILRFDNVMALSNGANANGVLGQVNFTTTTASTTQSTFDLNSGLASDAAGNLYVADLNNNRVLVFSNANTLSSGANANFVLLKSNFTSTSPSNATQSTGGVCSCLAIDNKYGNLLLLDRSNSRYLMFNSCGYITMQPRATDSLCASSPFSVSINATIGVTYQWQENQGSGYNNLSNTGIYSGVTTNTLDISSVNVGMNGYMYRCIITGSCSVDSNTSACTITVNLCTGINEVQKSPVVSIYPNPSNGEYYITNLNGENMIEVFNDMGQTIYTGKETSTQTSINLTNQPSGVYYVRITSEGKPVLRQTVIKQ